MKDEQYMQLALEEAERGFAVGEVPIGAVLVAPDGSMLARGHNEVERRCTQVAHAELLVLQEGGKLYKNWRLEGCTLYVTLEPCTMCMGAILLSRLSRLVFALSSPKFGYRSDRYSSFSLYEAPLLISEGVLAKRATELMQRFFRGR